MPEHIHLLISEPTKGTPSTAILVLKQRVSRRLRRKKRANPGQLCLSFNSAENSKPRFWQRRFYDFNVWSLKKRVEKLHYMDGWPGLSHSTGLCPNPRSDPAPAGPTGVMILHLGCRVLDAFQGRGFCSRRHAERFASPLRSASSAIHYL